jgi:hypothetical protein
MTDKDLTGRTLERRVADAYRAMGATKVEHDILLAGNQIDVYVELPTPSHALHHIAVEVKDHQKPVGVKIVNDFAQIVDLLYSRRLIHEGIIVGASGFTRPARDAAGEHYITLLEPADLEARAGQTSPAAPPTGAPAPQPQPARPVEPAPGTGPRIDPDNPPYAELRRLMGNTFQPDTLHRFCQDHSQFQPLLNRFGHGASLLGMIDKVFEHCGMYLLWEDLLDGIAAHSPRQYNRTAARLGWPQARTGTKDRHAKQNPAITPAPEDETDNRLSPNPFTSTLAIRDPARFVGREAELRRLQTMLEGGSVALLGKPKIGKSSLLWHLARIWRGKIIGPLDCLELDSREDFHEYLAEALDVDGCLWPTIRRALRKSQVLLLLDELDTGEEIGLTCADLGRLRAMANTNREFKLLVHVGLNDGPA